MKGSKCLRVALSPPVRLSLLKSYWFPGLWVRSVVMSHFMPRHNNGFQVPQLYKERVAEPKTHYYVLAWSCSLPQTSPTTWESNSLWVNLIEPVGLRPLLKDFQPLILGSKTPGECVHQYFPNQFHVKCHIIYTRSLIVGFQAWLSPASYYRLTASSTGHFYNEDIFCQNPEKRNVCNGC